MSLFIHNCRLVSPDVDIPHASIRVDAGFIADSGEGLAPGPGDKVIDAGGLTALPGFIDIHSHGRSGYDFCDATAEAFHAIGRDKLQDGVTGFLATTLTVSASDLRAICREAVAYAQSPDAGAAMLGIHLEGPFFNKDCVGAQNPAFLREPDISLVDELHAIAQVRKVSLSPELPGALELIHELVKRGIVASGGHSAADYECFQKAREAGLTHLTHFCNVMTPIHHLRFGMVGGGLLAEDVYAEIICDGIHLMDPMIDLIARVKGAERLMLITDSMRAAGCPDGDYTLGGLPVKVLNGCARLLTGPVAGSTLVFYKGFQRFVRVTGLPLAKAVRVTALNQAESLGISGRGRLTKGYHADIVLVNDDLEPQMTIVEGVVKWQKKQAA